jgi:serine/threonine-protein kinase
VDIYSFGIIAFVVLSGKLPLDGKTPQDLLWKQVNEAPPPLESVLPDVPPRLGRLVNEMLAKDPQARPFSVDAIAAELQIIRDSLAKKSARS